MTKKKTLRNVFLKICQTDTYQRFFSLLPKEVWTILGITLVSLFVIFNYVDMTPKMDDNFFFSSDDPQFQSEREISKLFLRKDTQIIISASGDIESPEYFSKINHLTNDLLKLHGITSAKSLSNGPNGYQDAIRSPLWKRLLISNDRRSTNLILLVDDNLAQKIIPLIEKVIKKHATDNFTLKISGLPYVIELIKRYLLRDLRVFSSLAFFIFAAMIYFIFRSKSIVFGTMISALNACVWTFMITDLMHVPIGLLTANLATIIFVLTLSHMIFLTYNWKKLCAGQENNTHVDQAVEITFPPSFWSMLTTLLGFLSLLFVPAKPLRELGLAGSIGTIIAIMVAYSIYPAFLRLARPPAKDSSGPKIFTQSFSFLEKERKSVRIIIIILCLIAIPGLWNINSDPSLLSFFSKKSEIYKGLEYIDKNGGSSPMIIVVKSTDGSLLNSQEAYRKLWQLQEALEGHRSVGSVISLPVLMAEAKQEPLAFLLFSDWLLNILEKPQYGEIAKSFVTEDRKNGLFLLRMNELNRVQTRLTVIQEIEEIVTAQGFTPTITGGVYTLQGHLAKLVASSLISGLFKLLLLFTIIAWVISSSWTITFAMIASLFLIPIGILGCIGIYRIPLDVVSSPASNVAIAMGIDSMIHMIKSYRRKKKSGKDESARWHEVRVEMWQPIQTSMIIVTTGFSIFLFSTFPPTQRFGAAIVFGSILATITALFIMPLLAQIHWVEISSKISSWSSRIIKGNFRPNR